MFLYDRHNFLLRGTQTKFAPPLVPLMSACLYTELTLVCSSAADDIQYEIPYFTRGRIAHIFYFLLLFCLKQLFYDY